MTIDDILASANPPIEGLREVFTMYCSFFGLSQQTCLALILMLDSRWALLLMTTYFYQAKERGDKLDTTDVVLMAEKVRKAQDKRKALGLDPDNKKKKT